jgi:flagellar motility protein MotE (MotC chaperone)
MYGLKDLKHLEVMANLINSEPVAPEPIDMKSLIGCSDEAHELTTSEKILALCAKLRDGGFEKQASSLEQKFLTYKVASTHLYRAIDEDGEDLVNAAHPDGEHKVEDASDDLGTVETLLTKHKKIVDVVNKTPTGKLSAYLPRIHSVIKHAAAPTNDELTKLRQSALSILEKFLGKFKLVLSNLGMTPLMGNVGGEEDNVYYLGWRKKILTSGEEFTFESMNLEKVLALVEDDDGPSWLSSSSEKRKWETEIAPMIGVLRQSFVVPFDAIIKKIIEVQDSVNHEAALKSLQAPHSAESASSASLTQASNVEARIHQSDAKLKSYKAQLNVDERFLQLDEKTKGSVNQWLDKRRATCSALLAAYKDHMEAYKDAEEKPAPTRILANLDVLDKELNEFSEKWM